MGTYTSEMYFHPKAFLVRDDLLENKSKQSEKKKRHDATVR